MSTTWDDVAYEDYLADRESEQWDQETHDFIERYEKVPDPKTDELKVPQRSRTRLILVEALTTMDDYSIRAGYDFQDGASLAWMVGQITPPPFHRQWGSQGKPDNLARQVTRLFEAGLVRYTGRTPENPMEVVDGIQLTEAGIIYAYRHGRTTFDDVAAYWAWSQEWRSHPTTNIWYLGGAPQTQADFQFCTPAFNSQLLQRLKQDPKVRRRYAEWPGDKIGRLVAKSHVPEAEGVYDLLEDPEKRAVIEEAFRLMGMPDVFIADQVDAIHGRSGKATVKHLIKTHASAKPITPDVLQFAADKDLLDEASAFYAETVIVELLGRVGWAISESVMAHRVNDNSAHVLGRFGHDDPMDSPEAPLWSLSVQGLQRNAALIEEARKALEAGGRQMSQLSHALATRNDAWKAALRRGPSEEEHTF